MGSSDVGAKMDRAIVGRVVLVGSLFTFVNNFGPILAMPFMQEHRDKLGCDALCYGSQTSAKSALTLVGSVVIGRLSDRVGRHTVLWLGVLGSVASLSIGIIFPTLFGMWLALVPSALLNQNFSMMKALFTDYHPGDSAASGTERAGAIGRLGMAGGMAMMAGSGLASSLVSSYISAQAVAVAITLASAPLIFMLPVPTVVTTVVTREGALGSDLRKWMSLPVLRTPGAQLLVWLRISMGLAFWLFYSIWSPSLHSRFGFGAAEYGRFMSFVGFTYAVSQGLVAKPLIRFCTAGSHRGDPSVLLCGCMIVLGLGRCGAMFSQDIRHACSFFFFVIIALGITNTLVASAAALLAGGTAETGGLYGFLEGCEAVAGMVGPALGGLLAHVGDLHGFPNLVLGVVVCLYVGNAAAVALWYRRHVVPPDHVKSS